MKKTLIPLGLLCLMSGLSSCTKTIYSHSQVMSNYRTKQQVLMRFGEPTTKDQDEGLSLWYYDLGTTIIGVNYKNTRTTASVTGGDGYAYGSANTNTFGSTRVNQYGRFVKFAFDKDGNTASWTTQGVDFSEKKTNVVTTVLFFLSCAAIGVGIGIATSGGN